MNYQISKQMLHSIHLLGLKEEEFLKRAYLNKNEYSEILSSNNLKDYKSFINLSRACELPQFFMASYFTDKLYPTTIEELYKIIDMENLDMILDLISMRSFVYDDNNLYYLSPYGKISEAIDCSHMKKLYNLLLDNGYVEYLTNFPKYQEVLKLNHAKALLKLDDRLSNYLICGLGTNSFNLNEEIPIVDFDRISSFIDGFKKRERRKVLRMFKTFYFNLFYDYKKGDFNKEAIDFIDLIFDFYSQKEDELDS